MLIIFLLLIFLIQTTINAQQQKPKQLTINDAVQRALKHNPNLEAMRYAVQAWKSGAKSEIAGYFPTVGLSSDISLDRGSNELDSTNELNVGQLIYSFAGPLQRYQQAKNAVAVSELDSVIQSNATRLETEKAFLLAYLVQEKEKTITSLKASAWSTFQRQEQKNKLEKLDKDEWLKNIADFAASMAQVEQYSDDILISHKKLEYLMGESLSLLAKQSDKGNQVTSKTQLTWSHKKCKLESIDTYNHYALTSRSEVPQGLKRMEIEKWNVKLAQGARLPEIRASAEFGCVTNPNNKSFTYIPTADPEIASPSDSAIKPYWSLGVSMKWSIFDGLVQQHKERQAEADKLKEMLKRDQAILTIKQEVNEKYYSLVKVLKQFDAQKIKYMHGSNHFKLMKQRLDLGRIAQVDFAAARTEWQTVQFDWLAYSVNVALAEHELMWACGYPERFLLY